MKAIFKVLFIFCIVFLNACSDKVPEFNSDQAYKYLEDQCELGYRLPGSAEIQLCRDYLISHLQEFGAKVTQQNFTSHVDNRDIDGVNIIAEFHPQLSRRVLLGAHYDTRPWSDKEEDEGLHKVPVMGGNDGASGVAVLLEIGRILSRNMPSEYGVDLVFFDLEDMGTYANNESWCLGSEYFAQNYEGEFPEKAIIVDMIGDKDQEIPIEFHSYQNAPALVREIWDIADDTGVGTFKTRIDKAVYDDHYPLLTAGFNAIDIIDFDYEWWHTTHDTPDKCSPEALGNVGKVLVNFLYN